MTETTVDDRQIVILGDLHGSLYEFQELLDKIKYDPKRHRLISCGDLIDRGDFSVEVVRLIRQLGIEVVKGNHDDSASSKILRWRLHEAARIATGKHNPMKPLNHTYAAYNEQFTQEELEWLDELPISIDLGYKYVCIHGGLEPNKAFHFQDPPKVMRTRYIDMDGKAVNLLKDKSQPPNTRYWTELWDDPRTAKHIVYGHCVHSLIEPRVDIRGDFSFYGIDTGCCFGGMLTAAILTKTNEIYPSYNVEFLQVKARKQYYQL
jgi:predicted phosphodiesterase